MGNILSALGLIMDIIGAYLIFKNGVTADLISALNQAVKYPKDKMSTKSIFKSRLGFRLLLIGFVLQLIGTLFVFVIPSYPKPDKRYDACRKNDTSYYLNR